MDDRVTSTVGSRLRHAREGRGVSLSDAARQTKLSINVIQAIERDEFASLPGGLYRRAYVRTLAAQFGLDANGLAADYCAAYEPPLELPVEPARDRAGADRWLQQLNSSRRSIVTPAILAAAAAAWLWLPPGPVQPSVRLADDAALSGLQPTMRYAPGNLAVHHSPGAVSRAAAVDRSPHVPLRIEVVVTAWCWVAAESDGERALYRLLEPGERVVLEGQRVISLRLGNAGSATLSINDGPRRSAGEDGEVVELTLTPGNAEAMRDGPVETVSGN